MEGMMAQKANDVVTDALLLMGGGIIGAGLALLLAPQTGKQTRQDLANFAETIEGKANEAVIELAESINDFAAAVGSRSSEILHNRENLTQESKKELLAALEKGQENLEKLRNKLIKMMG
jgi:gas vesicle protein